MLAKDKEKDFLKISKKELLKIFTNNFLITFFLHKFFKKIYLKNLKNASVVNIGLL